MKKSEKIVLLIAVIVAVGLYFGISLFQNNKGEVIVRRANGEVLLEAPLSVDKTYTIQGDYGEFHLEIKDGKARAVDVDCPNKDCEAMGYIYPGSLTSAIICLPNALYVELENNE